MKLANSQERVKQIQQWIGGGGPSIRNAYVVNASGLAAIGADKQGIIEQILWRIAKETPNLEFTANRLLDILQTKSLLKEAKKQVGLNNKQSVKKERGFDVARRVLIESKVNDFFEQRLASAAKSPDALGAAQRAVDKVANAVEAWVKKELPLMTNTKAIQQATILRIEADVDFTPMDAPFGTKPSDFAKLEASQPGRVYHDNGNTYLLVKPDEKAELGKKGLEFNAKSPEQSID